MKDTEGFMWFGTFNGLSRYDGYTFTQFVHDPSNHKSIEDNYIRCLYESKGYGLFVGFQFHGFCIYNKESETFEIFRHQENDKNSLCNDYLLTIYGDKKGNIWIGTRSGLDKFNPSTRTFTHYLPFKNTKEKKLDCQHQ